MYPSPLPLNPEPITYISCQLNPNMCCSNAPGECVIATRKNRYSSTAGKLTHSGGPHEVHQKWYSPFTYEIWDVGLLARKEAATVQQAEKELRLLGLDYSEWAATICIVLLTGMTWGQGWPGIQMTWLWGTCPSILGSKKKSLCNQQF
jgi:hypothetical protein